MKLLLKALQKGMAKDDVGLRADATIIVEILESLKPPNCVLYYV
jgi:hypothetical protein